MLTPLLCSLSSGLDTHPKTRTVEYSGIPEDVAVGEIAFGESRLLYTYVNSSNIITVLAAGAIGIFSVAIFLYLYDLFITGGGKGYNRNDNVNEADFDYYDPYGYTSSFDPTTRIKKRSASDGYDFNAMNVIQWISTLQEVYEKFDYNDLECQKRLICEVLKEEEYFGNVSKKMKSGFQLARYLEVLNMPDDFRELLDEYLDASERSVGQKECEEFFQCPYSLKDSVKRNFNGNAL